MTISSGIPIELKGPSWKKILKLASDSDNGRAISRRKLLDLCRRETDESGQKTTRSKYIYSEGLTKERADPDRYLASFFSARRKDLDNQIDCPEDRTVLFQPSGQSPDTIDLGFVVRPLINDGTDHYSFGSRRS